MDTEDQNNCDDDDNDDIQSKTSSYKESFMDSVSSFADESDKRTTQPYSTSVSDSEPKFFPPFQPIIGNTTTEISPIIFSTTIDPSSSKHKIAGVPISMIIGSEDADEEISPMNKTPYDNNLINMNPSPEQEHNMKVKRIKSIASIIDEDNEANRIKVKKHNDKDNETPTKLQPSSASAIQFRTGTGRSIPPSLTHLTNVSDPIVDKVVSTALAAIKKVIPSIGKSSTSNDDEDDEGSIASSTTYGQISIPESISPIPKVNDSSDSLNKDFRRNIQVRGRKSEQYSSNQITNLGYSNNNFFTNVRQPTITNSGNYLAQLFGTNEPYFSSNTENYINEQTDEESPILSAYHSLLHTNQKSQRKRKFHDYNNPNNPNFHYFSNYNHLNNPNISTPHLIRFIIQSGRHFDPQYIDNLVKLDTPITHLKIFLFQKLFDYRLLTTIQTTWRWKLSAIVDDEFIEAKDDSTVREFIQLLQLSTKTSSSSLQKAFVLHSNMIALEMYSLLEPIPR